MTLFPLLSHTIFSSYFVLFAIFSTRFVPSGAFVQSYWKNLFENELPQSDRSAQTLELFAEMDEVDSVLTDRMSAVIPPPPSPAHPKFQKLYLDKKEKSTGQSQRPKANKNPWQRLRSLLPKAQLVKKIDGIVQMYKTIKDSSGDWGVLIQKMFNEMVVAKQFGEGSAEESQKNCQTALQLIRRDGGKIGAQLDEVKPFESSWSLVKSAAQSLVALFKDNAGDEKARLRRTVTFLRVLKTIANDRNALKGGAGLKTGRRRRKRIVLSSLAIIGIVIVCIVGIGLLVEILRGA
ncbi:hypothetical protein niasHT_037648 [Heterodera trifolii]|uniref:Transmembrane protein n=1 Tax=Heterodera trifolii TaxID=157864 RepID=A0ABD2IE50_9BILA